MDRTLKKKLHIVFLPPPFHLVHSQMSASNELEEFRRQWRQEVESRKHQQQSQPTPVEPPTTDNLPIKKPTSPLINGHSSATLQQPMSSLSLENKEQEETAVPKKEEPVPVSAMDHYIFAVNSERQGRLGEGTYNMESLMR